MTRAAPGRTMANLFFFLFLYFNGFLMNHNWHWKVLCWNIRGLNSDKKWNSIRDKVFETQCNIVCLQETKIQNFDLPFIRNFYPSSFDSFIHLPSNGASGRILVVWQGRQFRGELAFQNEFAMSVTLTSQLNGAAWLLTTVYAPCTFHGKREFLNWLKNIQTPDDLDWLIVGDFDLMRRPENRNKEGADVQEMFLFNEAISNLGLVEIPLLGRQFTWTNKQIEPLLERLDWFFTSANWTLNFSNTTARSIIMETSDHWPCIIEINTVILAAKVFRFENYWLQFDSFKLTAQQAWLTHSQEHDPTKRLTAKFKHLRGVLKVWKNNLSSLGKLIQQVKSLVYLFETIELLRDLSIQEWNFRNLLYDKLVSILKMQKIYWKQRAKIRWVQDGDAGTKLFHAHATVRHRKKHNCLSSR